MAIIISKDGENAARVEPTAFRDESQLQSYILNNPDSLPLDEIDEDIRLLIAAREFPTDSGPIDALGLDADGQIYVIETKLDKNADRRNVVAQALDYGAALWRGYGDFEAFRSVLDSQAQKQFGMPLRQKLMDSFDLDEDNVPALLEGTRQCLANGQLRFVVLMNRLDERLKDLIVFVNQNSSYDIYGVELEFYRHEGYDIVIPRLFGAEVRKSSRTESGRKQWNETSFVDQARSQLTAEQLHAVQQLLRFSRDRSTDMGWGTGAARASFSPKFAEVGPKSVYSVYADGNLVLNFHWLHYSDEEESFATELSRQIQTLPGVRLPNDHLDRHISIRPDVWSPQVDAFLKLMDELLAEREPG